ncbi:hypothetical protein [Acidithiobacillus sp.]|uniref:hypothetical protein n=1 Tax=Acidithiobacillus sp. TaxID=1872118 RepID=UPI003CFC9B59
MNWFELLDAVTIVALVLGVNKKYGSPLNPVALNGGFCFVSYIIGSSVFRALGLVQISKHILDWSQILSTLSFLSFGVAYLLDFSPFDGALRFLRRCSSPFGAGVAVEKSGLAIPILLLEFCVAFLLLAAFSGAGLLWLSNPREAYQDHRSGVGVWWALSSAALYLAYFAFLLRHGKSVKRVFGGAFAFSACSYVLGSKGLILGYFLFGLLFVQYHLVRLSGRVVVLAGMSVAFAFIGLEILFGAGSLVNAVLYFDYMPNTQQFLDSPEFSFQNGRLTLSSLWLYVPRALYPAKPHAYGAAAIDDMMDPGSSEEGHTAGLTGWVIPYTDFGVAGVVFFAVFEAWVSKAAFELFLREKSLISFALAGQIGFPFGLTVFYNAPFPVFWLWLILHGAVVGLLTLAGGASRSPVAGPVDLPLLTSRRA